MYCILYYIYGGLSMPHSSVQTSAQKESELNFFTQFHNLRTHNKNPTQGVECIPLTLMSSCRVN